MATEQNLDILIQADANGVKTGMNEAQNAVTSNSARMQQATEKMAEASRNAVQRLSESFKELSSRHTEAMQKAANDSRFAAQRIADSMRDTAQSVDAQLTKMGDAVGFVTRHFALMAAAVAGAGAVTAGIKATNEFTGEANKLARALGISATEAATLNVALGDVYSSADDMAGAANSLARQLRTNEEGLNKMGLVTRDANGEYRNMKDLMSDAIGVLNQYKEGTDRSMASQVMFRKSSEEMTALLRLNNDVIEAAREKQEQLGLVVGVANVQATKAYKAAMNDVGDVMLALRKGVGDQLMPIFTQLAEWFASIGPAAVTVTKGALGGLAAAFWYVRNGVVTLWETINAMVITVAEPIRALAVAISKAMTGDFSGAGREIIGVADNIKGAWATAMQEMEQSSAKTNEKVKNLFVTSDPAAVKQSGTKDFVNPKEKKDQDKEPKLMRGFEAELSELKVQYQEAQRLEGSFREFSKQQELEFWEAKIKTVERGSEDEKAIRLKIAQQKLAIDKAAFDKEMADLKTQMAEYKNNTEARLEIANQYAEKMRNAYGADSVQYAESQRAIVQIKRQAADQMNMIDAERAKVAEAYRLDEIENLREQSQMTTQLGLQTREQELIQERQFQEQMHQIKLEALQQKLKLAEDDPDKNPVEIAKLNAQIEQLELQHKQRMRQIDRQMTVESRKDWASMFSSIQSGLANVIKGVMNGTMTMGQAVKAMMVAVGQAVINTLANIAARWIMNKVIEMIWGKAAATSQVAANSAVAATAAMASVAAIPFVGWAMAPGVGASTYAMAMAYGATIPAAAKGFDIPAGVNPITQLHEKEMVLPARQADVIRDMADNGGPSGGGVTLVVQTLDVGGVKDFLRRNSTVMAPGLRNLARNFSGNRS